MEYKSKINPLFNVYIISKNDSVYDDFKKIIPPKDIAFTITGKKIIVIDGEEISGLSKYHVDMIEAHEIAHHMLGHKSYGDQNFEMEADYAAYAILLNRGNKKAAALVKKYWNKRHNIAKFEEFEKIHGKTLLKKLNIPSTILSEAIIKPDIAFVKKELNINKNEILSCKTNKQCEDVLNDIFNDYWIIVDRSNTPDEDCLITQWSIDTANNVEGREKGTTIVQLVIGKKFIDKIKSIKTNTEWNSLVKAIETTIGHEYVHKKQLPKIPSAVIQSTWDADKVNDSKYYLSIPQEIMAFAYQAVKEFQMAGANRKQILDRIRKPADASIKPKIEDSDIFRTYLYFFKPSDKIFRKFITYMYHYVN